MSDDRKRAAAKIIKRLKSTDDNDKLAALAYLIKLFDSPESLVRSDYSQDIWKALRSTHFLERALHSEEMRSLVFMILSVFCRICPFKDMEVFIPKLMSISCVQAKDTVIEICQSAKDVSRIFELIPVSNENLELLCKCLNNAQTCTPTPAVYKAREIIFSFLTGHEDLSVRKVLFLTIARIARANSILAITKAPNVVDISSFLAAERLALIELRLQLDLPLNYLELEENMKKKENRDPKEKIEFTQKIGDLINPELAAAACEVLELLMIPLVEHEEELTDVDIENYFDNVNTMIKDSVAIFVAAKGDRDKDRVELKCLLSIVGKWCMECPFLCHNNDFTDSLKQILQLIWWFPKEALHFIPAFSELCGDVKEKMKAAGFSELAGRMREFASEQEQWTIDSITKTVYQL